MCPDPHHDDRAGDRTGTPRQPRATSHGDRRRPVRRRTGAAPAEALPLPHEAPTRPPGGGGGPAGLPADKPETVVSIGDTDTGRWQVTTAASVHIVDLDQRTILRIPGAGPLAESPDVNANSMDDDNEPLVLRALVLCVLGYSMISHTAPGAGAPIHIRVSTPVLEIRRLPDRALPDGDAVSEER